MKKSRFTEEKIIEILKLHAASGKAGELCRQPGIRVSVVCVTRLTASVLAMQRGEALRYPRGFAPRPVAPTGPMGSNDERALVQNG